ncbi:oligosaccharide flippase family protein [Notoacmeibacter sp. MSK16QG-6]|uniref:oligosaccharide flippase family protein n=1 Tax=Notoacmeibacter sp. MSK16QG-6 TaxID=2957982 RepID=UPI00209CEA7D|nr:oligosaccharide flippase family protein [Notoacmeibacter sp. MSK16QG-6]MCP1199068.1 oligosaccharide flippase family protein [Notoacmeibacter sp. MSK16QG-6]
MTEALAGYWKRAASTQLIRGFLAYSASEFATKATRLIAVVALAHMLSPAEVGMVAAAMAIAEILKAFTENGVVQKIIAAPAGQLHSVARTAHRVFTFWCVGLFLLQLAMAYALHVISGETVAPLVLALMAGEYLFMPGGIVQCALAMREGRLSGTAAVAGAQNVAANLLLALIVVFWPDPLSVAAARLASAPIWLIGMRRLRPWVAQQDHTPAPIRPFLRFGSSILGIEFLKVLRLQADKLIVGALMGPEALGIYFFAINAGFGIANSFSVAFATVLFPHLCRSEQRRAVLRDALTLAMAVLFPVICLQALAAPIYVPIVFGDKWAGVAPLVSILCFAALPAIVWSATAQWLRAANRPDIELLGSAFIAAFTAAAIVLAAPYGLTTVVWSVLASTVAAQLGASVVVLRPNLNSSRLQLER